MTSLTQIYSLLAGHNIKLGLELIIELQYVMFGEAFCWQPNPRNTYNTKYIVLTNFSAKLSVVRSIPDIDVIMLLNKLEKSCFDYRDSNIKFQIS